MFYLRLVSFESDSCLPTSCIDGAMVSNAPFTFNVQALVVEPSLVCRRFRGATPEDHPRSAMTLVITTNCPVLALERFNLRLGASVQIGVIHR